MDTGVSTIIPNGVLMADANGMLMTADGDSLMTKINGVSWPTCKGLKSRYRGACYFMAKSPKLANFTRL